jgi:two-component system phosphate regulon response regulator PhoB
MRRVLVIDDEADVRLLYRVNLRHAGHDVLEAVDGESGIELAFAHLPDALVLDLMLPTVDGFEVLRTLRADDRTRELPVRVLTANARLDDHRRCFELGADQVITKPFVPEALTEGVDQLMSSDHGDRVAYRREALAAGGAGAALR